MKRSDLVVEVLREIGRPRKANKTKHYLTKTEMMELLLYLRKVKDKSENKTEN